MTTHLNLNQPTVNVLLTLMILLSSFIKLQGQENVRKSGTLPEQTDLQNKLQDLHVAAWNERDRERRDSLMEQIYCYDIKMYDNHAVYTGIKAISDLIGKLQEEDSSFRFTAIKPIHFLQNSARLSGRIETNKLRFASMDIFIIKNGKVCDLYAYIEPETP